MKKILLIFLMLFLSATVIKAAVITDIEIIGLKNISSEEMQTSTNYKSLQYQEFSEQLIDDFTNKIYLMGYFQKVTTKIIDSSFGIKVQFTVQENPIIKKIIWENISVYSASQLTDLLTNKPGQVFNIDKLAKDKTRIENFYEQNGYELFKITNVVLDQNHNLIFTCNEGVINQIIFNGLVHLPSNVLLREMQSKPGQVFNAKTLINDRNRIQNYGYVNSISSPQLKETDAKVDLIFNVKEQEKRLLNLGFETVQDDWYFYGQTNFYHLIVPASVTSLKIQYGKINNMFQVKSYTFRHYQPWFLNEYPFSFTLDGWSEIDKEKYSTGQWYNDKRDGTDIILGYPFVLDRLILSGKLKYERVSPASDFIFTPYSIVSLALILDYKDITNIVNPKNGIYYSLQGEKSSNWGFIQNLNILAFTKYSFDIAQFFPISNDDVFGVHSFIGAFVGDSAKKQSFEFEGYTIGGSSSLRGYPDLTDAFGIAKAPNKLLFNFEYRHDFNSWLQGVLFCDTGVLSTSWDLSLNHFRTGYGFGFRFFTPVAPFRLDFGWGQTGAIIYFNLGQVF